MRQGRRGLSSKKAHSHDVWLTVLKDYLVCLEDHKGPHRGFTYRNDGVS